MKLFECQHCGQPLHFENVRCESCGHRLGYLPGKGVLSALEPEGDGWRALADPDTGYRSCANAQHDVCNWLVPAAEGDAFCAACRHNRTIPNLSDPVNLVRWRKIEFAKHRLFYTILKLKLPLTLRPDDPHGLIFDFIAPSDAPSPAPVMTGHAHGLITINLTEADDAEREQQRTQMGEPYRTLLGHFRHEIAHYFWDHLVDGSPALEDFRTAFGDEREDYGAALQRYYAQGPAPDWAEHYVTAYASSHPWEDFAETWAHYFHIIDTLETARAFGIKMRPRIERAEQLSASIDFDPHSASVERVIDAWLPLTFAFNAINRSMGLPDLYPFILPPPVVVKLAFIHDRIHGRGPGSRSDEALRAIIAYLRRGVSAQPVDQSG
jgi:hypothetical protein